MRRVRPEPRVIEWLKATNDDELYLSVITLGEIWKGFTLLRDRNRRSELGNGFNESYVIGLPIAFCL